MLKFFRKVRQTLLTENKFSKYLIYAIGEIVLVVIGILIALSINNNNQNRITKEKVQVYLMGLKGEFNASKIKLKNLMEVNKLNYEGAKKIAQSIDNDTMTLTEQQFSELLFNSFAFEIAFNPNNSLLNEMISSGSLKDIPNSELRIHLTSWESVVENIRQQEKGLRQEREKVLDFFRTNEGSIRTIFDLTGVSNSEIGLPHRENNSSNLNLLKSKEFENNILLFILTSINTESVHYKPLMEEIDTILKWIDVAIKE